MPRILVSESAILVDKSSSSCPSSLFIIIISGYPNGKMGIAAICVAIVGFIMAMSASYGCTYFRQPDLSSSFFYYFGLFYGRDSTGVCLSYTSDLIYPPSWQFARAMAILATVFGIVALGFTFSLSCVSVPKIFLKIMSITYVVAGLCIILTLVAFAECEQCSLSVSGYMAIFASIFYFITATIVFKIPAYDSDDGNIPVTTNGVKSSKRDVTTTIEVTELPDGSIKTVKTVVDEYGNETVEETLEIPVEEEEEGVEREYLPDGSILTRRTAYDEDGNQVIQETIEKAPQA